MERAWLVVFEDGSKEYVYAERYDQARRTFSTNGVDKVYLTSPNVKFVRDVSGEAKVEVLAGSLAR